MADHPLTDALVRSIIRHKVRRVARTAGLTEDELPDLEHDILVRLLERLPGLDPGRGNLHALTHVVGGHAIADYLRRRRARKRDDRGIASLSAPVLGPDGEVGRLADTVGQAELDARRGAAAGDPQEAARLAIDLEAALAALPPELREAIERRLEGHSVVQIAKALGLRRTTASDRVRRARALLRERLRDYL